MIAGRNEKMRVFYSTWLRRDKQGSVIIRCKNLRRCHDSRYFKDNNPK